MPHIAVTVYPGRSDAKKRELAEKIKDLVVDVWSIDEIHVSVSIEDVPPEKWDEDMKRFPAEIMFIEPRD